MCKVIATYLDRSSCMVFPGSAGVSPAPEAAKMAALPGYKQQEHNGIKIMSRYVVLAATRRNHVYGGNTWQRKKAMVCSWCIVM
jgi:hypothetical protein